MPKKEWKVPNSSEYHNVSVSWSNWTNAGEVAVDGNVVDAWGFELALKKKRFRIGDSDAEVRWLGILSPFTRCELYAEGEEIPARQ